jgi:hypothetical protein
MCIRRMATSRNHRHAMHCWRRRGTVKNRLVLKDGAWKSPVFFVLVGSAGMAYESVCPARVLCPALPFCPARVLAHALRSVLRGQGRRASFVTKTRQHLSHDGKRAVFAKDSKNCQSLSSIRHWRQCRVIVVSANVYHPRTSD